MQLRTGINYTNIDDNNLSLLGDELRPEGNISVGFSEFIEATAKKTFQLLPIGNFVDAYKKATAMQEAGEWREADPAEQYLAGNATYYAEGKVKDFTKDEYRMSKEAWEKSEYYRADIDYQEDMTETLAKMLAENYDNARYRDALLNMRAENNTGLGQAMDTAAGFVTSMAVGIVDPINWLPFASALGVGAKAAGTVGQAFLQGAKAGAFEGAISMAISEAMVFQRQRALGEKDLTIADSVTNIAASALLGGLIGGAVRSYKFSKMTPEERALAEAGLADKTILLDEILLTDKLPHPLQEKADQFFLDLNFSDPKTFQFYIDMMPEASLADLIDLFALATHDLESGIKIDVVNTFLNNERLLNDVVRTYNVASLMGMHKNAPDLTLENFKEFLQLEKKKASDQLNAETNTTEAEAKINQDLEAKQDLEANTANTKTDDTNETTTEEAKTEEVKTDTEAKTEEATTENTDAGKTEAKTEEVKTDTQDRPYIKDREDFTLDEQNQIYELEDQVKGLKDQGKLTEQDLDTLVNQPNKALSEADKLDEATRYIMDCIKGLA